MMLESDVHAVLDRYGELWPQQVESLGGAGGFSGACFWRLTTPSGLLCLRRWPQGHPTPERLAFIHGVLRYAADNHLDMIPVPLLTRGGDSFVQQAGYLWELAPWLPGQADYHTAPSSEKLAAALRVLARFHVAAAKYSSPGQSAADQTSPGLGQRVEQIERILQGDGRRIAAALPADHWPELAERGRRMLALFEPTARRFLPELRTAAGLTLPMQPCIRDIWSDHVLFEGQRVSGLIDFGAMRLENVAGDVARLLGSLAGEDQDAWNTGLTDYREIRPFSEAERSALPAFDRSAVLLSGMNWLDWICLQCRRFDDRLRVQQRLDEILLRLEHLANQA